MREYTPGSADDITVAADCLLSCYHGEFTAQELADAHQINQINMLNSVDQPEAGLGREITEAVYGAMVHLQLVSEFSDPADVHQFTEAVEMLLRFSQGEFVQ